MRVLTYNVHGWQTPQASPNLGLIRRVIAASDANIVGLNEVFHPAAGGGEPALAARAAQLGMHFAFGPTQTAAGVPTHPPYGNALLSRWPIMAFASHHLAPTTAHGRRGLLEARLLSPTVGQLTVYVLHLDHRLEQTRLAQWTAANAWLQRDRTRPHVLLGDFNALAASDYPSPEAIDRLAAYQRTQGWPAPAFDLIGQVLKADYEDAYARAGKGMGATYPADAPERRIDYVFVPRRLAGRLVCCERLDSGEARSASDHLPVLAEIEDWAGDDGGAAA